MEFGKFAWQHKGTVAVVGLALAAFISTPEVHHHKNSTAEAGMNFSPEFKKLHDAKQAIGAVAVKCDAVTIKNPVKVTLEPGEAKVVGKFPNDSTDQPLKAGALFSEHADGAVEVLPLRGDGYRSFSASTATHEQAFEESGLSFTVKRSHKTARVTAVC